jgi:drug/metabolite transporter (DMT)-like permease
MRARHSPIGWIEAAACVTAIGALSLTYAVGHAWGSHPVAFILYAMLSSATALVAISGFGPDAMAIVRHPMSWLVGLSIILIEVFYFLTLTYVPPAHGNLVLRIGIPLAVLGGWALFRRRPTALGGVAAIVIVAATGFVVGVTAADVRWPMAAAGLLAAVFMVMRGFASEFHPWNRAAKTVHDKLRVTGLVVLVTSFLGLTLAALAASASALSIIPQLAFVPTLAQMKHVPTLLLGCVVGGAILTLMFYFNFSAVVKITTENLTAMMAFSPITAWVFQEIGVSLGLIAAQRPEPRLIAAMAVMIASVLVMFWAGRRRA